MLAIACNTKQTGNNPVVSEKDSSTVAADAPKTGADKDEHGCMASAGYTWSVLKNECIRSFDQIKLMPQDTSGTYTSAAFLLFNADKSKAELFLPGKKEGVVINRINESNTWKKDDLEIYMEKGYIIKQAGKIVYKSK